MAAGTAGCLHFSSFACFFFFFFFWHLLQGIFFKKTRTYICIVPLTSISRRVFLGWWIKASLPENSQCRVEARNLPEHSQCCVKARIINFPQLIKIAFLSRTDPTSLDVWGGYSVPQPSAPHHMDCHGFFLTVRGFQVGPAEWVPWHFLESKGGWCDTDRLTLHLLTGLKNIG